jgi:putative ATPase
VNAPLLSRSRIFRFERLSAATVRQLLERALADEERGLGGTALSVDPEALDHLADISGGDARTALNALETAAETATTGEDGVRRITLEAAEQAAQQRALAYDREGDEHYDTISAFIKSVRGSDPDAALYWLAKMLLAGEDIKFIARRLVILASEDIGNADPMALVLANAAAQAVMFIGLPEAQLTLSQAVTYLATAPKSNASYLAIGRATEDVTTQPPGRVPIHLRDSNYPGSKILGHGRDYIYPHDSPGHWAPQDYLPPGLPTRPYYEPTDEGHEATIKRLMQSRRGKRAAGE